MTGIIFWGNSAYSCNIFKIPKTIIRIIMNARNIDTCRQLFKNGIQKFIILKLDLVLTLHTPTTHVFNTLKHTLQTMSDGDKVFFHV